MKGLVIFHEGFDEIVREELKEFGFQSVEIFDNVAIFDVNHFHDLCSLAYKAQFAIKVALFLSMSHTRNLEEFEKNFLDFQLPDFIKNSKTFSLRIHKISETLETSRDLEIKFGSSLKDKLGMQVDLENPSLQFSLIITQNYLFLALDLTGKKLEKRPYRLYVTPTEFKATLDYSILRWSGWDPKKVLLNVYTKTGSLVLEAAHKLRGQSPYYFEKGFLFERLSDFDWKSFYEKEDAKIVEVKDILIHGTDPVFKNINFAKKNAKVAGLDKFVKFYHIDTSWLDVKFSESYFDVVIAKLPLATKWKEEKDLLKEFREFFYQVEYVAKQDANIVTVTNSYSLVLKAADKEGFSLKKAKKIKANAYNTILLFRKER